MTAAELRQSISWLASLCSRPPTAGKVEIWGSYGDLKIRYAPRISGAWVSFGETYPTRKKAREAARMAQNAMRQRLDNLQAEFRRLNQPEKENPWRSDLF